MKKLQIFLHKNTKRSKLTRRSVVEASSWTLKTAKIKFTTFGTSKKYGLWNRFN